MRRLSWAKASPSNDKCYQRGPERAAPNREQMRIQRICLAGDHSTPERIEPTASSPTALRIHEAESRLPRHLRDWQTDDSPEWSSVSLNPLGEDLSAHNRCPCYPIPLLGLRPRSPRSTGAAWTCG